jgi:alpha-galactosidase
MHDLHAPVGSAATDLTIGYVGGGSRGWARSLMTDLALTPDLGGEVRLYDIDHEAAQRNAELGARVDAHSDAESDWSYVAVDSMDAALDGADVVVCSTQDDPDETMAYDLDLPAEYGIHQTVGDTVGPGGCLRAMRAIPQYREVAATVREQCPDAWVLNFTNPMTVCTRTLYEEYPAINAMGICHEVYGTQHDLASLAAERWGVDADSDEVSVDVSGVNHFTWLTGARWNGRDLFELLEAELESRKPLPNGTVGDLDDASYFVDGNQIAFDLYDRFGAFPAAGDRHLAEFVPWYLDVDDPREVQRWGIRVTPSEYRTGAWPDGDRRREELLAGEEELDLSRSGEEAVDIVRALVGLAPLKTNLNLPNRGQAPDLPEGAVVETNVLLTAGEATPLVAGRLPDQVRRMVETHVENQETLVAAGFAGDVDVAYRAFLNDPLVGIGPERARSLFADLVAAERPYLEAWDLDAP